MPVQLLCRQMQVFLLIEVTCFQYCGGMSKLLYPVPFNHT